MIKISFPDGNVMEFAAEGKSLIEIISSVDPKLLNSVVAAKVNEKVIDLRDVVADGSDVELVGIESKEALHVLRHTATHIMAEAVLHLFPEAKLTIGPATDNGFFYDFDCPPFSKENLADIEKEIAQYDARFAVATEYNADEYAKYNALKERYDHLMHEWEKASYELEITEQN